MSRTHSPGHAARYFGGALLSQATAGAVTLSLVQYQRGACRTHTHRRAFLALVTAGAYREMSNSKTLLLKGGCAAFHPEGTTHADEVLADRTTFLIAEMEQGFSEAAMDSDAWSRARGVDALAPAEVGPAAAGRLAALHFALQDALQVEPLVAESLTAEALADRPEPRGPGRRPSWVNRALELVTETPGRSLSLREVAQEVGVHPVYLSRAFRAHVGTGLAETRRWARVRRAIAALTQGDPIAQVALDCGFADQSHLTRNLRAVSGLTPARWRALGSPVSVAAPSSNSQDVE